MSKFIYSETIPAEILPVVKEKFEKYEYLVPGWAKEVRIYWKPEGSSEKLTSADTIGDFAYRFGIINICPGFLSEVDSDREDTVIHELIHVLTAPLVNFYGQLLHYLDLTESGKTKEFVDEQFSEKLEGMTVDLTTAFLNQIEKSTKSETIKSVGATLPAKKKRRRSGKKK
jgi:hypothetical protein